MSRKRYFLPYELDAFGNAPVIAASCGLRAADVVYGNMLMWQHVWRTKSDLVTTAHVLAFFGANACEALVLFGHLEASGLRWRVKGAAEWLRVMSAQSEAGKKNAGNLKRGQKLPGSPPASVPEVPVSVQKPSGSPPALTATSDQPPATSEQISAGKKPAEPKPPKPPKPKKPPNPRHSPLVERLTTAYREETMGAAYDFGGRDAKAVADLLAKSADDEEILFRWRMALRQSLNKFQTPKTRTLPELVRDWNHYPCAKPDTPRELFDPEPFPESESPLA